MLKLLKFIIVCLVAVSNTFAQNGHSIDDIQSRVDKDYSYLDKLYKHLHSNPEISLQEEKTAKKLTDELTKLGFKVTQNVGGHGFVGILKNGGGPTIMIRTDLDGLPVEENTGLDYASKARTIDPEGNDVGVMHACGHDIHMTVFVGTARMLTSLKDRWKGTLVMIGQPAEEIGAGAKSMLDDDLFEKFPRPDYCLALHSNSAIPAGKVGVCEGFALANVDFVDIKVRGKGGHGAYPHTTKDPVVLAAQIVLALQTIVSREIKPV
ncbi:MAG: amidohydrolase, partial [Caldithrix sp.]